MSTAGFPALRRETPQRCQRFGVPRPETAGISAVFSRTSLARVLRSSLASSDMFRAALVSIVLALTLGQNATLLCRVWCQPQERANSTCEHQPQKTSPSVTGNESCIPIEGTTPFVREDGRRGSSASDAQPSVVIAPFHLPLLPSVAVRMNVHPQATPPDVRPLAVALRI